MTDKHDRTKRGSEHTPVSRAVPKGREAAPKPAHAPPTPTSVPPMEKRYVLYSPAKGIYLGAGCWSKENHGGKDTAPTFTTEELDGIPDSDRSVPDGRTVEIYPDVRATKHATMDACMNALLPGWNPKEEQTPHDVGEDQTH